MLNTVPGNFVGLVFERVTKYSIAEVIYEKLDSFPNVKENLSTVVLNKELGMVFMDRF